MTVEQKRLFVRQYCETNRCDKCCLIKSEWEHPLSIVAEGECLYITDANEEELDKAIALIRERKFKPIEDSNDFDPVNRPKHYTDGKIEVIDYIEDKQLGFCLGNAIKYISRAGKKDPDKEVEDLKKAKWYVERRIKELSKCEKI